MKKVTMMDVAMLAGVSKSTVSQYLNHRFEYMGEETKLKIESAIKELDYQPNYVARSLKQKRTSTIGIIVANIIHNFSTRISRAIEDFCQLHDYHVILCNADDDPEKEKKYIEMLRAKQVDGMILIPTGENKALYQQLVNEKYPLVFIDRHLDDLEINSVVMDNKESAYKAVIHFIDQGHSSIAMISAPLNVSTRIERVEGYKQALENRGLSFMESQCIITEVHQAQVRLRELMASPFPPTALLIGNDLLLMEVLSYLKRELKRIPEDLAIITFDEIPFADLYNPGLTTVAQPAYEMGEKAAQILLQWIENENKEVGIHVFEGEMTVRESCGKTTGK